MHDSKVSVNKKRLNQFGQWFLISLLMINVLYVTLGAIHTPLHHIDVIAGWGYKAAALYLNDGSLSFLQTWQGEFAHPQYPILLPAIFASIYYLAGSVQPIIPSLLSPIIYVCILICCYISLQKLHFSNLKSLLGTYVCSMFPPLMAQAGREHGMMADIYLCLLYWIGVLIMLSAKKRPYLWWWLVPITIIGSLIKTEGILLIILILFSDQSKIVRLSQLGLASLGLIGWQTLLWWQQIPSSYSLLMPNLSIIGYRIWIMTSEIIAELFGNLRNWYFFWWIYLAAFTVYPVSWSTTQKQLIKIMTVIIAAWVGMYLFSSIPIIGYVSSSLDRLLLQIQSLWYLIFVMQIMSTFKNKHLIIKSNIL